MAILSGEKVGSKMGPSMLALDNIYLRYYICPVTCEPPTQQRTIKMTSPIQARVPAYQGGVTPTMEQTSS